MSDDDQTTKKRSPVERVVVWGIIGILVVVVAIEARARFAYSSTLNAVTALIKKSEESNEYATLNEAREVFAGSPSESPQPPGRFEQIIQLTWFSLLKTYQLDLEVEPNEDNPAILGVATSGAPAEVQELGPVEASEDAEYFEMPGSYEGTPGSPDEPADDDTPPPGETDDATPPESPAEPAEESADPADT